MALACCTLIYGNEGVRMDVGLSYRARLQGAECSEAFILLLMQVILRRCVQF